MEERLESPEGLRLGVLEASMRCLDERVARIEAANSGGASKKGLLDWVSALSPIISGGIIALVGWWLTGSVNQALQQRELEVSSGQAMQEIIGRLRNPKDSTEADAAALTLAAAFPAYAAVPLVGAIDTGTDVTKPAAEEALRLLALGDRSPSCKLLATVVDNRTRLFGWTTHRAAARLLADLDCQDSATALQRYKEFLDSLDKVDPQAALAKFKRTVKEEPEPTVEGIKELQDVVDKRLDFLAHQNGSARAGEVR